MCFNRDNAFTRQMNEFLIEEQKERKKMPMPEAGSQIFKCDLCKKERSLMNTSLIQVKNGTLVLCSWCYRQVKKVIISRSGEMADTVDSKSTD